MIPGTISSRRGSSGFETVRISDGGVQTVPGVLYRLRAKPDFLNQFKLFLPVQSLLQK
jgi:hypothetical protein